MTDIFVKLPSNASVSDMKQEIYWELFIVGIRFSTLLILSAPSLISDPPPLKFVFVYSISVIALLEYIDIEIDRGPSSFNPLTPRISLVILLTVCHTVLVMLICRIWYWINL